MKKLKRKINMHYNDDDHFEFMNNMDYFIGFKSDIIPGEIVKEEISEIARNCSSSIQRIEYFTKYYKFDELRNALLNKTKYCECKIKNIDIENQDIENKKINYDVSIQNENSFFYSLFEKGIHYYVLEDKSLGNKIYSEITIISYNFLNKGNDESKFFAKIKFKKKLIIDILNNCLKEKNNYYLFKYIYLMPSRNILYNNLYEEMISILKDEKIFDLEELEIKEKNFIKRIENEIETSIK